MFLETSKNNLDKLLEELEDMTPKELENVTLLPKETLKRLNEVSAVVQNKYKLKAQALSICKMIELCDQVLKGGVEKDD